MWKRVRARDRVTLMALEISLGTGKPFLVELPTTVNKNSRFSKQVTTTKKPHSFPSSLRWPQFLDSGMVERVAKEGLVCAILVPQAQNWGLGGGGLKVSSSNAIIRSSEPNPPHTRPFDYSQTLYLEILNSLPLPTPTPAPPNHCF